MKTLTLSAFFYGLLIILLYRLSDQFWDGLLEWLEERREYAKAQWARQKETLPFFSERGRGEGLLLFLQEAEARIALGSKLIPGDMKQYKFYTDLLEQLFESHRKLGAGLKKMIPDIRRAITRDLQFEKQILGEIVGALVQFMLIALTTWGFVFLSSLLVEIPLSGFILSCMLILQVSGAALFFILMRALKKKMFSSLAQALCELTRFQTMINTGLSVNEVLLRSNILGGALVESRALSPFAGRVKNLISRMKATGLSPVEETQEILKGLWHFQGEQFQKFTKRVQLLKFVVLALFFLPAYFLYLASIFQFFMEQ